MNILINDIIYQIPTLAEFTLGQRIDFHNRYGREIELMAKGIDAMEERPEKELDAVHFHFERIFRSFSFFTDIPVDELRECDFTDAIVEIYNSAIFPLLSDEAPEALKNTFFWNDQEWVLHPVELKNGSSMKFGEFIDAKQLIKDVSDMNGDRWDYMPQLCAIFLRKKGEAYSESFLYDNSERLALMSLLPMEIVKHVAFFLSSSMPLFQITSLFSSPAKSQAQVPTVKSILKDGGGSTSLNRLQRLKPLTSMGRASTLLTAQERHRHLIS